MTPNRSHHRLIVTGSQGQLGSEVCGQLGDRAIPLDRNTLDITKKREVQEIILTYRPVAVINCAAFTNVDLAEQQPDRCQAVNADGVSSLAQACEIVGCRLVQISTDYVFGEDHLRRTPYGESDVTGPINVYGRTKLDGERAAAQHAAHFIVRTCGLYGGSLLRGQPRNFAASMLALAKPRRRVRVVCDQQCTPTYVPHVARAVIWLLETEEYGTYHITNEGATSWYAFAAEIFRQSGLPIDLEPITSEEWRAAAKRPAYSVLDAMKYERLTGSVLPTWQEALSEYLASK